MSSAIDVTRSNESELFGAGTVGCVVLQDSDRWAAPLDEVLGMAAMLGVDIAKPGALTPKQAIKAGLPAETVAA